MHKFEIATEILQNILQKGTAFNLASKNVLDKDGVPADERGNVIGLVGCELRHHLLFNELIKLELKEASDIDVSPILLALANYHFYQKFDLQEVTALTSKMTKLDKKVIDNFLKLHQDKNDLIPNKYPKGSFEYLSLRYNTPLWLVKMLNKHYGRGLAFKILQANSKPAVQSYLLNGVELGRVLLDPSFVNAPVENMVNYIGKGSAKNNELYKKRQLLPEKMAFKEVLDKVDVKPFSNVAIFSAYATTMYVDLSLRLKEGSHIDLVLNDISLANDAKHHVDLYKLKNITVTEEKAANLLATISEKVDYFFLLARNSNLDLLRSNPDYFLRFNRDELDSIMNEQRYSLDEASALVNEGGQLIYLIPTLNKKESKQIINEFLLTHQNYSLLEEKQYFPFEELGSTLYVVRMLKKK